MLPSKVKSAHVWLLNRWLMAFLCPLSTFWMEKSICKDREFQTLHRWRHMKQHVESEDMVIHQGVQDRVSIHLTKWVSVCRVCRERESEFLWGHRSWPRALHAYSAGHTHSDPPPAQLQTTQPARHKQNVWPWHKKPPDYIYVARQRMKRLVRCG